MKVFKFIFFWVIGTVGLANFAKVGAERLIIAYDSTFEPIEVSSSGYLSFILTLQEANDSLKQVIEGIDTTVYYNNGFKAGFTKATEKCQSMLLAQAVSDNFIVRDKHFLIVKNGNVLEVSLFNPDTTKRTVTVKQTRSGIKK